MSTLQLSDCRSSSSLFRCQFEQTTLTPFGVLFSNLFFFVRSSSILSSVQRSSVQLFHMWESSFRVISERQMCHVIPSAINRLLQYSIFQLHTFQSSWWMHIQIQNSQKKKKKRQLNQLTHNPLYHQCQRCTCFNITDCYETEWVKMKRNLNFVTIKNILHERTEQVNV